MKAEEKRTIVHIDMDAFYASVEQLDYPEYRNKPVVVGADPAGGKGRGVVSAASYEAREFGIHSALPISTAYRLCPDAVYLRPRFKRYTAVSKAVMHLLGEFSPVVEQISIDEAFLDCTGAEKLFGSQKELALRIKDRIREETGLTASVGIASNKSIAKIASELKKPDGLLICPPGHEREFIRGLSLKYLWGAGSKTIEKLQSMGFSTIGNVAASSPEKLVQALGKYGTKLWELANGIDARPVSNTTLRKSISEEITFQKDVDQDSYVEHVLFEISDRLTRKMRNKGIKGKTVTVKIRLHTFETHTRSRSFPYYINDMDTVRSAALQLYRGFKREKSKIRLIGIAVSNLMLPESPAFQLDLFPDHKINENTVNETEKVLDMMKEIYGEKIMRASFLPPV